MKLVAFGDSFVAGEILKPKHNTQEEQDKINFVKKLTENYNLFDSYENHGMGGAGNEYIAYEVYKYLQKNQNLDNVFFLIVWSGPDRFYYYDYDTDFYKHALLTKTPYKHKHPIFQFEMMMLGLSKLLKDRNIKHAFSSSFTMYSQFPTLAKSFSNYIGKNFIRNTLFDIILGTFGTNDTIPQEELFTNHDNMKHAVRNKYLTPCYHPTELGNELIASVLSKELIKFIRKKQK